MASIKQQETKSGKRFFLISVSRGYGRTPYTMRWYWPDGWSKRSAEREAAKQAAQFERDCAEGKVLNRAEAKEKAAQEAAERAKLKSVKEYGNNVFMAGKSVTFSENARASYQMFLDRHVYPTLGDTLLTDVTPSMLTALLTDFQRAGYSHASTIKLYNICNGLFQAAFLDGSIEMNPLLRVRRPAPCKDEVVKKESDKALTVKELKYVLACVEQEPLKWRVFIHVAADTGLRRGELCGLQWSDIDFKAKTLTVRRNLQYTVQRGVFEAAPKSGKIRTVDVGPDVLALLWQLRDEQAASCISKWCFTQDGSPEPMFPQSPTKYFRTFGKKYGIEDFHPHKLRHSFASIAITSGADIASVSQKLGHADKSTTLRMYTHADQESMKRASDIFRDALKAEQG